MMSPMMFRSIRLLLIAAVVGCSRPPDSSNAQQLANAPSAAGRLAASTQVSATRQNAITNAISKISPSVVTVQTEQVNQAPQDPFDIFFGRAQPRTSAGLGTGFVVRSDGVIVTNAHVVAGATKVSVMMRDGSVFPAKVLGSDEANDIAVLRIDGKSLPDAKLGNSNNLVIGEWAIAIGNPVRVLPRQQRTERERGRDQRDAAQSHRTGRGSGVVLRHDPDRRGDQSR